MSVPMLCSYSRNAVVGAIQHVPADQNNHSCTDLGEPFGQYVCAKVYSCYCTCTVSPLCCRYSLHEHAFMAGLHDYCCGFLYDFIMLIFLFI